MSTKRAVHPPDGPKWDLPLSPAVVSGDLVYLAGQVGVDGTGELVSDSFEEQTDAVFRNMRLCLAEVGLDFEDVVKVNAFVVNLDDFGTFNEVYARYFTGPPYPARTTVRADLVNGFLVEVEGVARMR
jgi:2-iminobutanoate/2-iminopropanoate deaminase